MILNKVKFSDKKSFAKKSKKDNVLIADPAYNIIIFADEHPVEPDLTKVRWQVEVGNSIIYTTGVAIAKCRNVKLALIDLKKHGYNILRNEGDDVVSFYLKTNGDFNAAYKFLMNS